MRIALIVSAVLLATPALAMAQATAPAPASAEADKKADKEDPNRIVCKREHVVGSNRPQKVCMTVAERQRLSEQSQRITDESRRVGVSRDNEGGVPGS